MHFIIVKTLFLYQYMQSISDSTNGVSLGQGGLFDWPMGDKRSGEETVC